MIESVTSIVIARAVDEVFSFIASLDNLPTWAGGVHAMMLSAGPFGDGTIFQEDSVVVRVYNLKLNAGFETESIAIRLPARMILRHTHDALRFDSIERGTRFTLAHQVELTALVKPLERMIAKKTQSDSQAAIENVKYVLERQ